MSDTKNFPRVGVGVIIVKDGQILLGKRAGSHGAHTWCPPGGHLEFMETIEECARRETLEEAGLEIKNIQKPSLVEEFYKDEQKHYINLLVTVDWASGEPQTLEPNKCEGWQWFDWDNLPEPLFLPMVNQIKQGYTPFS